MISLDIGNYLLLGLTTLMCLSQSCTEVLLRVVCTNVIYVAIIFKSPVDLVEGARMPNLGMKALNGFAQLEQRTEIPMQTLFHECRVTHET